MKNLIYLKPTKAFLQMFLLLAVVLFNFGAGGSDIVYAAAPSNDNWTAATNVLSLPYSDSINVTEATAEIGEPQVNVQCDGHLLNIGTRTVWYKYKPSASGILFLDTAGSNYDTYLAVWTGSALNNLSFVGCDDDTNTGFTSQTSLNVTAGVTYYIQIARYNGLQGGVPDNSSCPASSVCTLVFNMKNQTFSDVPGSYWAWFWIEHLYSAGVTTGCGISPLRYCPTAIVTRDQMAVFLLKAEHGSSYVPPAPTGVFQDVPTSYWAAAWIERLAAEGITGGCTVTPKQYCPLTAVTRDQMAIFLMKVEHGSSYVPPAPLGVFQDVPTSYWAAAWIEQVAAEGITGGCSVTPKQYCPATSVTRDQMAVFLVKAFSIP